MSYIVKSRDFPKSCNECQHCGGDFDGYWCDLLNKWLDIPISSKKDKKCPMVEISVPHGRLIDADNLHRCIKAMLGDSNVITVFESIIQCQPTIIEAEVSE